LDLRTAQDALVAGSERLRHRRGRAQHVHDDSHRRRDRLVRCEGHVDTHREYATQEMTEFAERTCYRHPDRVTGLPCSECGRPICTECMTMAPVGIRCPEHSGRPQGVQRMTRGVQRAAFEGVGAKVTRALIALNVAVYVAELAQ